MAKGSKTKILKSPESRENYLISLAFKVAEQKLLDGTASSQLLTHFLKLATTKEELENEKLRADLKVAEAKVKHLESQSTSADLYEKAIAAFKTYAGVKEEEYLEDDE